MKNPSNSLAAITQPTPQTLALSCAWTARRIGEIGMPGAQFEALSVPEKSEMIVDGAGIEALDTAGAWVLNKLLHQLRSKGAGVQLQGLRRKRRRLAAHCERNPDTHAGLMRRLHPDSGMGCHKII
ncbi:STAS domain-containing protein [Propionivibrio limicola]|uniref:STAS domain-containing protein n=1 Tax=Propionivibrio limicola TaxID=167645 RepID=UPI001291E125|nr:STAS domain-containing protein [Propionivibrio limicola]